MEDRCSGGLGMQGEARDPQVSRKGLEVLARTAPQSLRAPVSYFTCPSDFGELRGASQGLWLGRAPERTSQLGLPWKEGLAEPSSICNPAPSVWAQRGSMRRESPVEAEVGQGQLACPGPLPPRTCGRPGLGLGRGSPACQGSADHQRGPGQ